MQTIIIVVLIWEEMNLWRLISI